MIESIAMNEGAEFANKVFAAYGPSGSLPFLRPMRCVDCNVAVEAHPQMLDFANDFTRHLRARIERNNKRMLQDISS